MKFIHISDLHIGITVNGFFMKEDQIHILNQILTVTEQEKADAMFIAGDVYDRSAPGDEAVVIFDDFLKKAAELCRIFIIRGNHDSAQKLAFGAGLLNRAGVHISPVYDGTVSCFSVDDDYGTVKIHLLPFLRPADIISVLRKNQLMPKEELKKIHTYTDALKAAVSLMKTDPSERNILLTHQFITGSSLSGNTVVKAGGTDNVDASVFSGFDYTALGHIHKPQNVTDRMRYCGTPLKYSYSEIMQTKTVTAGELREKGNLILKEIPLKPLHDTRELRGTFDELRKGSPSEDYIFITLTDEDEIPDSRNSLNDVYPNILALKYDNSRTRKYEASSPDFTAENRSPLELFAELYERQNNAAMTDEKKKYLENLIAEIWREA